MAETYIHIPGGRGVFRTDVIESISVYVPRAPFVDEITGEECSAVLHIETRRCLHKFNFGTAADASAVVKAAGLLLPPAVEMVPETADLPEAATGRDLPASIIRVGSFGA